MTEAELREKYQIPSGYACTIAPDGHETTVAWFNFCDHTIAVYHDGSCTETSMGFNGYDGHSFYTIDRR